MAIYAFPPVDEADEEGLLAVGGDLFIPSLLLAYTHGVFPWPISEDYPIAWFAPDPRGILTYKDLHVSSRLKRKMAKDEYKFSINEDFLGVIHNCAKVKRKNQSSTWITGDVIDSYHRFHEAGYAYSVEVKNQENDLVGGLYGVSIADFVSGESMFHKESDTSKMALIFLLEYLHTKKIDWIDTQMVTPVVSDLGGKEVTRKQYMAKLKKAVDKKNQLGVFSNFGN